MMRRRKLVAEGRIRRWKTSLIWTSKVNAGALADGGWRALCNQRVLYHLASQGIEYVSCRCQQHSLPVMACPLAQAERLRDGLFQHSDIINMANARGLR